MPIDSGSVPYFEIPKVSITLLMNAAVARELSRVILEQADAPEKSLWSIAKNLESRVKDTLPECPIAPIDIDKKQELLQEIQFALNALTIASQSTGEQLRQSLLRLQQKITSSNFLEMKNDTLGRFIISEFPITISMNLKQARLLVELLLDQEEAIPECVFDLAQKLRDKCECGKNETVLV